MTMHEECLEGNLQSIERLREASNQDVSDRHVMQVTINRARPKSSSLLDHVPKCIICICHMINTYSRSLDQHVSISFYSLKVENLMCADLTHFKWFYMSTIWIDSHLKCVTSVNLIRDNKILDEKAYLKLKIWSFRFHIPIRDRVTLFSPWTVYISSKTVLRFNEQQSNISSFSCQSQAE